MIARKGSRFFQLLTVCFSIWLVAFECVAAAGPPELPDPGKPRMSREQQKQLGLQAGAQVYHKCRCCPIPALKRNIFRLSVSDWLRRSRRTVLGRFNFTSLPKKKINAFALPGGPMFVNIGTITAADNEAQLAGVMAHEMAHVYMQHSAKQQDKGSLLEGLAGIAGAIAGTSEELRNTGADRNSDWRGHRDAEVFARR